VGNKATTQQILDDIEHRMKYLEMRYRFTRGSSFHGRLEDERDRERAAAIGAYQELVELRWRIENPPFLEGQKRR
jgi:hypothetical protein